MDIPLLLQSIAEKSTHAEHRGVTLPSSTMHRCPVHLLQISASTHPAVPASCTYLAVLGQFPTLYCWYSYLLQRQLSICCACFLLVVALVLFLLFSSQWLQASPLPFTLQPGAFLCPKRGLLLHQGSQQPCKMLSSDFKRDRGEGTFFSIIIIFFF